jgi:glyoxylase-like metal-dependent hydrolase (beta-lactamase superfamily II)
MAEIYRIVTPPIQGNAYLIVDEVKALVDVGGDAEFLLSKLKRYIQPEELEYVFLTHGHFDHAGAAGKVVDATDAKLLFHKEELPILNDPMRNGSRLFGRSFTPVKPFRLLKGGEKFSLGSITLEVIYTPGHTPGGICLYEGKYKWLFSGDTVFPHGNIGRTDLPGGNSLLLVESIEKLVKLDVEVLYPGHDEVTTGDVKSQIQQSLEFARIFA